MTLNLTTVAIVLGLVFVAGHLSHLGLFLAQRAVARIPSDARAYFGNYKALIKNQSVAVA